MTQQEEKKIISAQNPPETKPEVPNPAPENPGKKEEAPEIPSIPKENPGNPPNVPKPEVPTTPPEGPKASSLFTD